VDMIQEVIIFVLVLAAAAYLVGLVRKSFSLKNGACAKGCGCSSIDLKKVEKELQTVKVRNTDK